MRWAISPGSSGPHGVPEVAPLDPERIIRTLAAHGVEYVMIGALAARLQGFPRLTAHLDITPARTAETSATASPDSRIIRCDTSTPFGRPVVPDV